MAWGDPCQDCGKPMEPRQRKFCRSCGHQRLAEQNKVGRHAVLGRAEKRLAAANKKHLALLRASGCASY